MTDVGKKESWADPSLKATFALDTILETTTDAALEREAQQSSIETELTKAPVVTIASDRFQSRVLFLTRDVGVLEQGSAAQLHFINLSDTFNEVHVMVLCESWQAKKGSERLAKNVWVYTTSTRYWWQQMFASQSLAEVQLQFAEGFRPDIIVALDPFESGLSGYLIAEKYDREFQVHITEDYFIPEFVQKDKVNKWRMRIAKYVLKRTPSVRVSSNSIKSQIEKRFPRITDVGLLPRHYDIQTLLQVGESSGGIKESFPQYVFAILFVGKLDNNSTLFRALDASRSILVSKSIGFFILGDGPSLKEFQQRANLLGIQEQVVFQKDLSKLISYLKTADVLICTDTTEASDEIVIKAAAAGLPIIAAKTQLRADLFIDGESAFLCNAEDTLEFSQKLVKFLNTNSLRTQFSENARDIVQTRLHEDPSVFKTAYRNAIEAVYTNAVIDGEVQPETLNGAIDEKNGVSVPQATSAV